MSNRMCGVQTEPTWISFCSTSSTSCAQSLLTRRRRTRKIVLPSKHRQADVTSMLRPTRPTASPALRQRSSDFLYNYDAKSQRRRQFPLLPGQRLNEGGGGRAGSGGGRAGSGGEKCSQWGWRFFQVNGCETSSFSSSFLSLHIRPQRPAWDSASVTLILQVMRRKTDTPVKKLHCDSQPFSFPGKLADRTVGKDSSFQVKSWEKLTLDDTSGCV